jgi:hypothetical protein
MIVSLERWMRGRQDGPMAEIVNLRREKKRRVRIEAAATSAQNRALHGRTKAERTAEDHARVQAARGLDGARLPKADDDAG